MSKGVALSWGRGNYSTQPQARPPPNSGLRGQHCAIVAGCGVVRMFIIPSAFRSWPDVMHSFTGQGRCASPPFAPIAAFQRDHVGLYACS